MHQGPFAGHGCVGEPALRVRDESKSPPRARETEVVAELAEDLDRTLGGRDEPTGVAVGGRGPGGTLETPIPLEARIAGCAVGVDRFLQRKLGCVHIACEPQRRAELAHQLGA